ncbi:hypothetical protein [Erythrobacter sp. R86502]|uniref:hypothetical protein n=1 Tax=Erythrobacter sp. R86502 TaxID=3093846 RepID=UPI0036D42061
MTTDSRRDYPAPPTQPARFHVHFRLWLTAAMLFAFPVLGMAISDEVAWGWEDFAAMALLLGLLCGAIEIALHVLDAPRWRIAGIGLAVLLFLTAWAHLAVGIFR